MLRVGLALIAAIGLGSAAVFGWGAWRIWEEGARDAAGPAGAVVVLGAAQYNGRPSPVFAARIDHAVQLVLDGRAPYLVVTGGKQEGDRTTEAATARAVAIARGIPPDAILVEDEGRDTLTSLRSVARILAAHGVRTAIFVSDPTHMLRVLLIARDEGVEAVGSPTRTSPIDADPLRQMDATIHELGALVQYFLVDRTDTHLP